MEPLSRLPARLEVDTEYPKGADLRDTHRIVLPELDGFPSLVDDLLLLAQTEPGRLGGRKLIDLDDIVLHEATTIKLSAGDRLDLSRETVAQVTGHAGRLARIVRSLLDNAVTHEEGRIRTGLSGESGRAVFVIADKGTGIHASELERVFERFARLDQSRSRGIGGAGLGVAIALQIVRTRGGDLHVESDSSRERLSWSPSRRRTRLFFRLRMPSAPRSKPQVS